MATEGAPPKKSRRIVDDEDDEDEGFPDITDTSFLKSAKSATNPAVQVGPDQAGDEGLFSDEDENEKDEAASHGRKRFNSRLKLCAN